MTTVYSGYSGTWKPPGASVTKKYRARLDYYVSGETATTITYAVTLYANVTSSLTTWFDAKLNFAGSNYTNNSVQMDYGDSTTVKCISQKTKTFAKGASATTATISGSVKSTYDNAGWGDYVTASVTVAIPANSYTVAYDANGGVNPPAPQTKVRDVELELTNGVPSRDGYDFVSWNTAANGTGTSYQRGGTMPAEVNQDTILYAQWHITYQPPQTYNVRAYRTTDSASETNPSMKSDGTRCYCDFEYTPSVDPDATTDSITIQFGESTSVNANAYGTLRYGYSGANHLPATQNETVTIAIEVTDYLGNEYHYEYSTFISTENYVWDAYKGSQGTEQYQSFAIGGQARDFTSAERSENGNFDIYMDIGIVLADCTITDSGTALSVTAGADTEDGQLAQAVIDAFDYATAKDILEV